MVRSSADPKGARNWIILAGAILAFQGVATIFYAGFLPPPITDAGITVPILGHLPFVWLAAGGLAIVAAVGVLRVRRWGRVLGIVSEILTIAGVSVAARSLPDAAPTLLIAGVVLFVLWRRWPGSRAA